MEYPQKRMAARASSAVGSTVGRAIPSASAAGGSSVDTIDAETVLELRQQRD